MNDLTRLLASHDPAARAPLGGPPELPTTIAGRPVVSGSWMQVRNPYNGETIASIPSCTKSDLDDACSSAHEHLLCGLPQHKRAAVLAAAADSLLAQQDPFARIIALEAGKPLRSAHSEVQRCVDTLRFASAEALALSGELVPMEASSSGTGRMGLAMRVPVGVVGAITPFNFPLNLVAHKVAPAVAAGCPIVLKPAPATPLSALAFADLLTEAGLPPGWLSVVTGPGNDLGEWLVAHPTPRLISFTGSAPVGWAIAAAAPRKRVCLELGANSPVIVEPDAELDLAAERIVNAAFGYAGQSCISVQRVLAHESVFDDLTANLAQRAGELVVGDPLDSRTDVGPVINTHSAERIMSWIAGATAAGAGIVAGGSADGSLVQPTVLVDVPVESDLWRQEVFGPVMVVARYHDLDEAISLANDSDFGLQAGIFTNNLAHALEAVRRLDFGGVLVNEVPTARVDQQPYGGTRESGNTREGPRYAIREMTELRFVSLGSAW